MKIQQLSEYKIKKITERSQRVMSFIVLPLLLGLSIGAVVCLYKYNQAVKALDSLIYDEINIEYAHKFDLSTFFVEVPEDAAFVTDLSTIDTSVIGSYPIEISVGDRQYESVLNVVDLTAPTANPVAQEIYAGDVPDPAACVKDV